MITFTIDADDNITAFPTPDQAEAAVRSGAQSFASQQELTQLAAGWQDEKLVAIWNSLPGVAAIKKFRNRNAGIGRIWARIQGLGESASLTEPRAKSDSRTKRKASPKGKAGGKAKAVKSVPKRKLGNKHQEGAAHRDGSKAAQVIVLLKRKNGATLREIMEKMGWQNHTVRGFMAGAMKKAGYTVESFKPEGGDRTYRLNT